MRGAELAVLLLREVVCGGREGVLGESKTAGEHVHHGGVAEVEGTHRVGSFRL